MRIVVGCAAFAVLAGFAHTAAAQSAARGKQFFETPILGLTCSTAACHTIDPAANANNIRKGANAPAVILAAPGKVPLMSFLMGRIGAQDAADLAAYIANPAAAISPVVSLSANALAFGSTQVAVANATATPANITLTNTGGGDLTLTGIARSGANATDFVASGSCAATPVTVPAGGSCTIGATFTPGAVGARAGTFTLQSNAAVNPSIALSGTGATAATPSLVRSETAVTFGSQTVGSASAARTVTLTNNGTVPVMITQVSATPAPEFTAASTCIGTLAAGANCAISVNFAPSAVGNRTGSLSIVSNATGSPHVVTLAGPGVASPTGAATLATSALSFPATAVSSAATPLRTTLTNTGNAPLMISSVAVAGANAAEFRVGGGNTCVVGALAVDASCQLEAEFRPASAGSKSADLVVAHSAGTATLALGGMARATAAGGSAPVSASYSSLAPSNVGGGGAMAPWWLLFAPLALLRRRR